MLSLLVLANLGCSRGAAPGGPAAQSYAELAILCVLDLDAEVDDGGFEWFVHNSSGNHAADTGASLRDVGLPELAGISDRALQAFPGTPDRDIRARRVQVHPVPDKTSHTWSALGTKYDAIGSKRSIAEAVARYARSHAKHIGP